MCIFALRRCKQRSYILAVQLIACHEVEILLCKENQEKRLMKGLVRLHYTNPLMHVLLLDISLLSFLWDLYY